MLQNNVVLDRKEAAQYLGGICLTTLSRLDIPRIKLRRRVMYQRSTLDKWLEDQMEKGKSHNGKQKR